VIDAFDKDDQKCVRYPLKGILSARDQFRLKVSVRGQATPTNTGVVKVKRKPLSISDLHQIFIFFHFFRY
jgi:hypothetical protein